MANLPTPLQLRKKSNFNQKRPEHFIAARVTEGHLFVDIEYTGSGSGAPKRILECEVLPDAVPDNFREHFKRLIFKASQTAKVEDDLHYLREYYQQLGGDPNLIPTSVNPDADKAEMEQERERERELARILASHPATQAQAAQIAQKLELDPATFTANSSSSISSASSNSFYSPYPLKEIITKKRKISDVDNGSDGTVSPPPRSRSASTSAATSAATSPSSTRRRTTSPVEDEAMDIDEAKISPRIPATRSSSRLATMAQQVITGNAAHLSKEDEAAVVQSLNQMNAHFRSLRKQFQDQAMELGHLKRTLRSKEVELDSERRIAVKLAQENEALKIQLDSLIKLKGSQDRKIQHLHHILSQRSNSSSPIPQQEEDMGAAMLLMDIAGIFGEGSPTPEDSAETIVADAAGNEKNQSAFKEVKKVVDEVVDKAVGATVKHEPVQQQHQPIQLQPPVTLLPLPSRATIQLAVPTLSTVEGFIPPANVPVSSLNNKMENTTTTANKENGQVDPLTGLLPTPVSTPINT